MLIARQQRGPRKEVFSPGLVGDVQVDPQHVQGAGEQLERQVEQADPQTCTNIAEENELESQAECEAPIQTRSTLKWICSRGTSVC